MGRSRLDALVSVFVTVHPHESSALLHSFFCFFFVSFSSKCHSSNDVTFTFFFFRLTNLFNFVLQILSAYFIVLPLRDEGAISLGLSNLPELFIGSLLLTVIATPFTSLVFSLPNLSKNKVSFYFITFLYSFNSIFIIHINRATPIIIWENGSDWS